MNKKRWVCVLTLVGRNTVILFFYSACLKVNTFLNCLHIFPYIYLLIKILWLLCLLVFLWQIFKGTLAILFIASPQFNFAFYFYKNIYKKKGSFALLLYFAPFCTEEKRTPIEKKLCKKKQEEWSPSCRRVAGGLKEDGQPPLRLSFRGQ